MRECPHCKAQIGEDTRFCLYCMTPLTEKELILPQKKKNLWWVFVAVGAVLLGLVAALMLLRDRNPVPSQPSSGSSAVVTTASTTLSATDTTTDSATESATGSTTESTEETTTESTTESTTEPATEATTEPPATNPPATEPPTAPTTPPVTEPVDISTLPRYEWKDPNTQSTYRYRPAVQSDVLGLNYWVTENDVVLEMVYDIFEECIVVPSYVDGKRVVAIGNQCYADYAAINMYSPETLLAIHDGAVTSELLCFYFAGETLALESESTLGKNTHIRTTKTCRNQYGECYAEMPYWKSYWAEWTAQTYSYRTAQKYDEFDNRYQNVDGDIVITGINWPIESGIYDIPAYIDGKKVIAISYGAFKGSNMKTVYIPATLGNIWDYALKYCSQLTDIYFRGEAVYTGFSKFTAFKEGVTLHCSATCHNRNGRIFKDDAALLSITWVEWNG